MNIEMLLNEFMSFVAEGKVEVYNEFCLQHELGIFLRARLIGYKVQLLLILKLGKRSRLR